MPLLDRLKLVHGAVGDRTLLDIMTAFHIYDGRLQGMNGRVAIDAECSELKGVSATVEANRFLKAIEGCEGEPTLTQEDGLLCVKHKRFRAKMKLMDSAQYPRQEVEPGKDHKVKDGVELLEALRILRPFVSQDASRPWSMGVLLRDGFAYATNNVILLRVPVGFAVPPTVIPVFAIDELLRIGCAPDAVRLADTSLYFQFASFWLRSQLMATPWPDAPALFKDWPKRITKLPDGIREALAKIEQFIPDEKYPVIFLGDGGIATMEGDYSAQVEGFKLPKSAFRVEHLKLLFEVASHVEFSIYPGRCPFKGDAKVEGFIVGVKT
jgi:hypothetical protein